VSVGGPPAQAIAANATVQATLVVREAAQLGQLCISVTGLAGQIEITNACQVTEITHNNDLLISSSANCAQFSETSLLSPLFGHIVQVNDELTVSVVNNSSTAGNLQVSFTTI
jgi:hypothetical protein